MAWGPVHVRVGVRDCQAARFCAGRDGRLRPARRSVQLNDKAGRQEEPQSERGEGSRGMPSPGHARPKALGDDLARSRTTICRPPTQINQTHPNPCTSPRLATRIGSSRPMRAEPASPTQAALSGTRPIPQARPPRRGAPGRRLRPKNVNIQTRPMTPNGVSVRAINPACHGSEINPDRSGSDVRSTHREDRRRER
jgi:hypothetical protein